MGLEKGSDRGLSKWGRPAVVDNKCASVGDIRKERWRS